MAVCLRAAEAIEHGGGHGAVLDGGPQFGQELDALAGGGEQGVGGVGVLRPGQTDAGAGRALPAGADAVGG
ncbi:hypothetical protein AB0L14_21175 [Streptomyces sp. NPDC052727]|uniref:hypothetical protein n=1 Tax=Streptomyces sp. NPDC052727 TaxID=3154854 RepID=UPI0034286EB1